MQSFLCVLPFFWYETQQSGMTKPGNRKQETTNLADKADQIKQTLNATHQEPRPTHLAAQAWPTFVLFCWEKNFKQ